ncbi:MAG TPA: hypothetical protein VEP90_04215 [Methylomirabilota bacterium]|nr:hypothetical protein [Methylomirabilota bacterium]
MGNRVRSPLSRHDLDRLKNLIAEADLHKYRTGDEYKYDEIIISSRRMKNIMSLRIYGVVVRTSDEFGLNEGLYVRQGHEPIKFSFEEL